MNLINSLQSLSYYENEHTLIGLLGHASVVFSFVIALLSSVYFIISTSKEKNMAWQKWGIIGFRVHFLWVCASILCLYYMIFNHYYEYEYVWKHSNNEQAVYYLISCFWSGQQGSILLWAFCSGLIGMILSTKQNIWRPYLLAIFSLIQVLLCSLLLGVYVDDWRIGESPFMLMRSLPENIGLPWTEIPDYISKIQGFQDGRGLNPLLQNYWMVIHPPTLFLGFASTQVPFAFAIASLWRKDFKTGLSYSLPWTFFGIMILGIGILMGGAWAYEALSFGGFWAWDPVENASLVPWLVLVGAGHCMLIARQNGNSIYTTLLLSILAFVLVWYSTFLTRSGILGESSVHSFAGEGMLGQLLIYLFLFISGSIVFLLSNRKLQQYYIGFCAILLAIFLFSENTKITFSTYFIGSITFLVIAYEKEFSKKQKEENIWSKEFWLFIGTMVLVVSALQITLSTSIPVINRLFDTNFDAFTDLSERNAFYNTWQLPFAVALTILMAVTQFLKYRHTAVSFLVSELWKAFLVAFALSLLFYISPLFSPTNYTHLLLIFSSTFTITANGEYILSLFRGGFKSVGSAFAHIGFGMILLGATLSMSGSQEISENTSGKDLSYVHEEFDNKENILLSKYDTLLMGEYFVSYQGKRMEEGKLIFDITYFEAIENGEKFNVGDSLFSLHPFAQLNDKFGNVAEPDTKHFLSHDVFTHIKWAEMENTSEAITDDYMPEANVTISVGDQFRHENLGGVFRNIYLIKDEEKKKSLGLNVDDIVLEAHLSIREMGQKGGTYDIFPVFIIRNSSEAVSKTFYVEELETHFTIRDLKTKDRTIVLGIQEREYIVMEAIVYPYVNILWAGCVLMAFGCGMAIRERLFG